MSKRRDKYLQEREAGFTLQGLHKTPPPSYNALMDRNLRQHFENKRVQTQLQELGLVDAKGRIVNVEKHNARLAIVEQEFRKAEESERKKEREELEVRRRVQQMRHDKLHEARRLERLEQIKDDRRVGKEIVKAARSYAI